MALTLQQLQAQLDAINTELGNPEQSYRAADGRMVVKRPVAELLLAKADLEDQIRDYGGGNASKSTLGQHKRGDGPYGPGFPGPPGWGWW